MDKENKLLHPEEVSDILRWKRTDYQSIVRKLRRRGIPLVHTGNRWMIWRDDLFEWLDKLPDS